MMFLMVGQLSCHQWIQTTHPIRKCHHRLKIATHKLLASNMYPVLFQYKSLYQLHTNYVSVHVIPSTYQSCFSTCHTRVIHAPALFKYLLLHLLYAILKNMSTCPFYFRTCDHERVIYTVNKLLWYQLLMNSYVTIWHANSNKWSCSILYNTTWRSSFHVFHAVLVFLSQRQKQLLFVFMAAGNWQSCQTKICTHTLTFIL